jgi:hypothetical protein
MRSPPDAHEPVAVVAALTDTGGTVANPEPGSPDWWLHRLYAGIHSRRPAIQRLAAYYDGRHNLAFSGEKFLEAFGGLFASFADNWCQLVVDAVEERLTVNGFRVPTGDVAVSDPEADATTWRIWQANNLDGGSQVAHTEALLHGACYVCVWNGDDPATPDVTIEHASNAIVVSDPKRRNRRLAALRLYMDEYGYEHAELFLPDTVHLYRSPSPRTSFIVAPGSVQWVADESAQPDAVDGVIPNPLGVVPMVELANRPRLFTSPMSSDIYVQSEIAPVIPLQDATNKLLADMLIASEFAAYPQRWLVGYEAEVDPESGETQPLPFSPKNKLWWLEDPDAKFGSFATADLGNYTRAIEVVVQHIASITRTPPHYLNGQADRLSGESIKAAESGLVAKVKRKQQHFGTAWEEVMRLCGLVIGEPALSTSTQSEVIWADPESRTESEHVDAMVKLRALDLPPEFIWERLGLTPTEIARARAMQADASLFSAIALPPAPLVQPAPTQPER